MNPINPFNYLGLLVLGLALLWAVRLFYGARRVVSNDILLRVLLLVGWLSAIGGLLGVTLTLGPAVLLALILLVIIGAAYLKYMAAERRTLLWALTIAAEKGIPLPQAARAFANERPVQLGLRSARLADLLEAGAPLSQALIRSRNPVSADALLAVRLGCRTGQLGSALRMSLAYSDQVATTMRHVLVRYAYVLAVLAVMQFQLTFMMLKIVPVFAKMFSEFGLRLPAVTQLVIEGAQWMDLYWYLLVGAPVVLLTLLAMPAVSYYVGWSRYEIPLFHRFWRRRETGLVLRALAWTVRQQQPLAPAIQLLSHEYPKACIARRLSRAAAAIDGGSPWCDALLAAGLIKTAEAAVLRAAERAGNLAWALEEMSDSVLRRFVLRIRLWLDSIWPVLIVGLGLLVGFLVISLFMPLISMIEGLS